MSALGQKQTCAAQKVMSALPPKADMCGALGMSAKPNSGRFKVFVLVYSSALQGAACGGQHALETLPQLS